MEVELKKPGGCVMLIGTVFKFGLNRYLLGKVEGKVPSTLTDDELVLRNGQRYDWGGFTKLSMTDVFLKHRFVGTRIELKHGNGDVTFGTDKVVNIEATMHFLLNHLPESVVSGATASQKAAQQWLNR